MSHDYFFVERCEGPPLLAQDLSALHTDWHMYALALSMMTDDLVKDQMENGFKTKHEAWIEE